MSIFRRRLHKYGLDIEYDQRRLDLARAAKKEQLTMDQRDINEKALHREFEDRIRTAWSTEQAAIDLGEVNPAPQIRALTGRVNSTKRATAAQRQQWALNHINISPKRIKIKMIPDRASLELLARMKEDQAFLDKVLLKEPTNKVVEPPKEGGHPDDELIDLALELEGDVAQIGAQRHQRESGIQGAANSEGQESAELSETAH